MSRSSAPPVIELPQPGMALWSSARRAWAWAALGLVLVSTTAAYLHWDALAAAGATWVGSPTYSYGMLVPPVVALLIWRQRTVLRQMAPRPSPWGLVLVGGAALVASLGQVISALVIEQLAFVAMLQAATLTLVGPRVFRALTFPLLYLYLAVPVGDGLIAPLQQFTARFAVGLLDLLGLPVRLDGLLIHIPSATFHIAEACAGLRFLLASVALGLLLAHLFFRSWRQRLLFAALSIALPIVGNGVRAAGVVLIAHLSDARFAVGVDHLTYGYVFTGVLLACLVALATVLGSPRRIIAGPAVPPGPPNGPPGGSPGRVLVTAGIAALVTALPALAARPAAADCPVAPILSSPDVAAPWASIGPATYWRPLAANPDAELRQGFRRSERAVDLYIGYYCAQRDGAEVVSQAHQLTGGAHWLVQARGSARLDLGAGQLPVQTAEVRFAGQPRLVLVWYWVDGRFTADPLVAKLLQAKAVLLGGPPAAAVIVASTPLAADASTAGTTVGEALRALATPLEQALVPGVAAAAHADD